MKFYLYYVGIPFGFFVVFCLLMFFGSVARKRSPKVNQRLEVFEKWVRKVWPTRLQRDAIVLLAIVVCFIWALLK